MPDEIVQRHGLESRLDRTRSTAGGETNGGAMEITIMASVAQVNLRGNPAESFFLDAAQAALGQELPLTPNTVTAGTVTAGAQRVLWLGPDEWLILSAGDGGELAERLSAALDKTSAAVNELSGGQTLLRIRGPAVRDLLAAGCTLDFHPGVFGPGDCAQSGLAKATVIICHVDDQPTFDLIVRRSFSAYLLRWMRRIAASRGCCDLNQGKARPDQLSIRPLRP